MSGVKVDGLRAWYALFVLLLAYILSFIDRNILAMLVAPIRQSFAISDLQFSFLHGFAFAMFYIVLGLPIGRLADRANRKWIVTVGVFLWSIMTCLCGMAKTLPALFIARVGVGVGEAALSPPAYSLMGDYFSAKRLRFATAIFALGITLGSGLSYKIGGAAYAWIEQQDLSALPIVGELLAWQATFVLVGLPGLLVVVLLLFVKEPARQQSPQSSGSGEASWGEVKSFLVEHWRVYLGLMGGVSMMAIIGYGTLAWFPEYLQRSYAMDRAEAGNALSQVFIWAGSGGTLAGAWFAGALQNRGYDDANMRLVMIAALVLVLPATIGPLTPTSSLALAFGSFVVFVHYPHFGVAMAAVTAATPNNMRALVAAILLFMSNLFGLALGGSIVAFATDVIFANDASLNYSLSLVAAVFYPLAAILIWQGLAAYRALISRSAN